ncbi:Bloom syndrome [Brachionus plicatilis]|uniref:Bloom syndrome n=1 Tax=Brachionus plicatilis TaxID=10195 RepID=A0A3M7PUJ4_BRAPC|nr:Bloom syndrome [Brachionus plicatilis]
MVSKQIGLFNARKFVLSPFNKIIEVMVQNGSLDEAVFDAVHCIYKWGNDFRRKYLNIGESMTSCCSDVKIIIVTATAI